MTCVPDSTGEMWSCASSLDWAALLEHVSANDEHDPVIVALARTFGSVEDLVAWVSANVAYVDDPPGVEVIRAPAETVGAGFGDCDDHARLVRALCRARGWGGEFVWWTRGSALRHVAVRCGRGLVLDTTAPRGMMITT